MMLADHDLHVRPEIVFVTQDFDHSSAGVLRRRGPVGDLDIHYDVLQVGAIRAPRHFLSQHAIWTLPSRSTAASGLGAFILNVSCRFLRILHARRYHDLLRDLLIDWRDVIAPASVVKFS